MTKFSYVSLLKYQAVWSCVSHYKNLFLSCTELHPHNLNILKRIDHGDGNTIYYVMEDLSRHETLQPVSRV